MQKKCPSCGEKKSINGFYKNKRESDGASTYCKVCTKKKANSYWRSEGGKEVQKKYRGSERHRQVTSKYTQSEKAKRQNAAYNRTEKAKTYKRKWMKESDKNIDTRVKRRLRSRIYNALKQGYRTTRSKRMMELLGCEWGFFREHIESLFAEEMSWENYGQWHIDHIKPCVRFDLSKEEAQRKCFHYSNLQPLWRSDNLKKGSKYEN